MPGIAASTSETWLFGSPPNSVEAPENNFEFEVTWAWTSSPITISQSPVAPLISFEFFPFMRLHSRAARRRFAPIRFRADLTQPVWPPADTSSRHWRNRPRHGADRHEPRRLPPSLHASQYYAPCPIGPWRPTTMRPAAVSDRVPEKCPTNWCGSRSSLPPPRRREPSGGLLDHFGEREQRLLVEGPADQLQAERQALRVLAGGEGHPGQASHVHGHRKNVVEIHFHGVGALLANTERRRRRRRREDRVHTLGEDVLEILLDQRADLLRAQIIGVVIAGREHIGADHDAAGHFVAKPLGGGGLIHLADRAAGHAQAIARAVIARQV